MHDATKIAIGAIATALMAWGAHSPLGKGADFVSRLQAKADANLAAKGLSGIKAVFPTAPLSRYPLMSGAASQAERDAAEAAVGGIPGLAYLRWEDGGKTAEAPVPPVENITNAAANVAEPAVVSACQSGVNGAVAGRVINFKSGSAYIAPDSLKILDDVATALKPCTNIALEVGGHTDSAGSAALNQTLSQERADRVKSALIERGIAAEAITATGYGSTKPANAADGRDPANRRIAFTVTKGGA
jgi:OmpA-OmpF porin, OOP family